MSVVPHILRLIDASERFGPCHLWDGDFGLHRVAVYGYRRAVNILWEMDHGAAMPDGYCLTNTCGHMTCVRLDHWRLTTREESFRLGNEKKCAEHFALIAQRAI